MRRPTGSYRVISIGKQLGVGVADSYFLGLNAVAKKNTPKVPYCIPNELVCGEIGRFLRLPVPPCGIVFSDDPKRKKETWFASLDFTPAGDTPPPVDAKACATKLPDLSTGLLCFDILIANADRHSTNLAFFAHPLGMHIFDHSHALLGLGGVGWLKAVWDTIGISDKGPTYGNRHCLLDYLREDTYFEKWIARVKLLPDFFVEEVCREASRFGISAEESEVVTKFLKHRRDNLRHIIWQHRAQFRGISQWGMKYE